MAHNTTVKKEATNLGFDAAINWADHIIDNLENQLLREQRTLNTIAKLVVEGNSESLNKAKSLCELVLENHLLKGINEDKCSSAAAM